LCCLFLVTYRTFIAFYSESNAVTIYVNKFGEQYLDIFALVIFWIIVIIGLFFILRLIKEDKIERNLQYRFDKIQALNKNKYFFDFDDTSDFGISNNETFNVFSNEQEEIENNFDLNN